MPSLVLFGRRWAIGSDDFVFPSIFDIIFRGSWLLASVIVFLKSNKDFNCEVTEYCFIGLLAILTISILLDTLLIYFSKNGSIMETHKRKQVPIVLYTRIFIEVTFISWNFLVCFLYWTNSSQECVEKEESLNFIFNFIVFNCILFGIQFLFFVYVFDIHGASNSQFEPFTENNPEAVAYFQRSVPKTQYSRLWLRRLYMCNCACFKFHEREREEVQIGYRELARLCGLMLGNEDIVHSDAMAGFILLAREHRREKRMRRSTKKEITRELYIMNQPKATDYDLTNDDWRSFWRLSHFLKYASGIFGWPIVFAQQNNPIRKLAKHTNLSTCLPWKENPIEVEGDNCCFLNTAALKATIEAECEEIVYVTHRNKLYETPFFVALDHATKSVVIGIRGSMSANDAIIDFVGWPMPIPGYPPTFKAHHGMLIATSKVLEKLEELKILPRLFSLYPDYQLVIAGHSLGAGCSTILSLMLKPDYPQLKCYAYAPPGGLLSKAAAEYCDDFVISLTYGDDVVTRLGILQLERLKTKLINILKESKIPKYQLLMDGFLCCKKRRDTSHGYYESNRRFESLSSESKSTSIDMSNMENDNTSDPTKNIINPQAIPNTRFPKVEAMYPPGKIIQIRRAAKLRHKIGSGDRLEWMWRYADRTEFDDIIVSRRMFLDHVPLIMPKSLKYLEKLY